MIQERTKSALKLHLLGVLGWSGQRTDNGGGHDVTMYRIRSIESVSNNVEKIFIFSVFLLMVDCNQKSGMFGRRSDSFFSSIVDYCSHHYIVILGQTCSTWHSHKIPKEILLSGGGPVWKFSWIPLCCKCTCKKYISLLLATDIATLFCEVPLLLLDHGTQKIEHGCQNYVTTDNWQLTQPNMLKLQK